MTMADKLTYIPSPLMINKITLFVEYNRRLKHLNIQLNELTNQNSKGSTKNFHQRFKSTKWVILSISLIVVWSRKIPDRKYRILKLLHLSVMITQPFLCECKYYARKQEWQHPLSTMRFTKKKHFINFIREAKTNR